MIQPVCGAAMSCLFPAKRVNYVNLFRFSISRDFEFCQMFIRELARNFKLLFSSLFLRIPDFTIM